MVNSVSVQTTELLYSALLGIGIGVLFDVFRVFRVYLPKSRVMSVVLDIVFWLVATLALLMFVLTVTGGEMRWYVLLGTFCGGFVYSSALGNIVFKVILKTVAAVQKLLGLITRPIYLLLGATWRKTGKTVRGISRRLKQKRKVGKHDRKKTKKEKKLLS